jgi:hypothetical protein
MLSYLCSGWYIFVLHVYIYVLDRVHRASICRSVGYLRKERAVIWKSILKTVRVHFCSVGPQTNSSSSLEPLSLERSTRPVMQ